MKKVLILFAVCFAALLIVLSVFLLIRFAALAQTEDSPAAQLPSVEDYARQNYPEFSCAFDGACLTLSSKTQMTYETACSVGASIYCDELAPETYLPQVRAIRADLISACEPERLLVRLVYLSSEGETIWSIDTDGTIFTCWKAE